MVKVNYDASYLLALVALELQQWQVSAQVFAPFGRVGEAITLWLGVSLGKDRLVNLSGFDLDVLRPLKLLLPFEKKSFSFCIPRDRWDKEFFKLQGG
ncbi:hypothetical protein J1N35_034882 [Gossypium stocksii]|uniref:Uncharacterized protein n=1 Tax=Gossypium stocksii TaxID=47602 RepID=A0A9D3USW1_9ROSI|nr:hypothetical protein J1N35_034882 [Gossypium stocksii]